MTSPARQVPFYRHQLGPTEAAAVARVIETLFLTTGPRVAELETEFAKLLDLPHACGVTSCTTALHLALEALGVGPGDEVITTPMTFIATSNAVLYAGATPVFVDVEPDTGNLDVARVAAAITPKTRAILPVHLYGQMVDMRALAAIAKERNLAIVEDCAHAVESRRDGVRPGELGDAAAFSFYATKNLTCGEGGAVATRRADVHEKVRTLRLHGMSANAYQRHTGTYRHWDMVALGHKANMADLQAALLLPQLPHVAEKLALRERVARVYDQELEGVKGVERPVVRPGVTHARHLYTVWVDPEHRDEILHRLQQAGVGVAVNYRAVHLLTWYQERFGLARGTFPNAERIGDRTLSLPMYPTLPEDDARYVARTLAEIVGSYG